MSQERRRNVNNISSDDEGPARPSIQRDDSRQHSPRSPRRDGRGAAGRSEASPRGSPGTDRGQGSDRNREGSEKREEEKKEDPAQEGDKKEEDRKEEDKQAAAAPAEVKPDKKMTFASSQIIKVAESRSNLLTMGDRHQLEQEHMIQLESGGGLLGTSKIDLHQRKIDAVDFIKKERARKLPTEKEFISLLQNDGLFVDSALIFKNKDINVQKLEERLINAGQSDKYFKIDG